MASSRLATRSTRPSASWAANAVAGRVNGLGLGTAVGLVAVWEAAVRAGVLAYQYLPAPTDVFASLAGLVITGELPANAAHTVTVTLVGWVASAIIGISLGVLLGLSDIAYRYSMTSFEVIRAIPPITLVPAALLVFGFSLWMELVIVIYAGTWVLLMNTVGGVRNIPNELMDVARMLRLSRATVVRKIVVPSAMPAIVVGLRLALSLCLVLAVVAEMVGNPSGLGNALISAQQALQPEEMFAYVLATGALGVALNATFRRAAAALLPSAHADDETVSAW